MLYKAEKHIHSIKIETIGLCFPGILFENGDSEVPNRVPGIVLLMCYNVYFRDEVWFRRIAVPTLGGLYPRFGARFASTK